LALTYTTMDIKIEELEKEKEHLVIQILAVNDKNKELKDRIAELEAALEKAWREISSGGAGIERARVTLAQALEGEGDEKSREGMGI